MDHLGILFVFYFLIICVPAFYCVNSLHNDKKYIYRTLKKRNIYNIVPLFLPHLQHYVLDICLAEISVNMVKNELFHFVFLTQLSFFPGLYARYGMAVL